MKSVYLFIAVFCVVPCAFQDAWDEYEDTWYDDSLMDAGMQYDQVDIPETAQNDGKNDKIEADNDYKNENNYKDYEIEDNRDEIKTKVEEEQEPQLENKFEQNDESAIEDFDALEQIIKSEEISEKSYDVNKNKESSEEKSNKAQEDNIEGIQADIEDIQEETMQILNEAGDVFDEENGDDTEEIKDVIEEEVPKMPAKMQSTVEETRQILEKTNDEFDENKNTEKDDPNDIAEESIQDETVSNEKENKGGDTIGDEIDIAAIETDMKSVIDETRKILEETNDEFDENKNKEKEDPKDIVEEHFIDESINEKENENDDIKGDEIDVAAIETDMESIIEETRQILEETNSEFDENKDQKSILIDDKATVLKEKDNDEIVSDEDTVDRVYKDINEDLENLLETLKKISADTSDENSDNNSENVESNDEQAPKETNADDGYGRNPTEIGDEVKEQNNFDYEGESRILQTRNDYYDSILDKDLSDLFKEFEDDYDNNQKGNDAEEKSDESSQILYVNDALDADSGEDNHQDNTAFQSADLEDSIEKLANEVELQLSSADNSKNIIEDKAIANDDEQNTSGDDNKAKLTKDVDKLTSTELDELSDQFVMLHDTEMKMDEDQTPIHITLTADKPVVIESPNYPDAYPTDTTTIDWILEGLGTGIEVNVTDLAINSAMGHYLMLKPGQSDGSGDQGIVFAYRINHERLYRFRDVNKMFVRFNPVGGMSFSKGFQLSARIIEAPASDDGGLEEIPDPESLIPEPQHTATLLLAGVNSTDFQDVSEEFRRLLADMATMYIQANDIDPGMNATIVVTQITRTYVCNINWPGFDSCVQVTFGVPLIYEEDVKPRLTEDELIDMWYAFAGQDPFAARLSRMGISDYSVPQDSYILTVWVVIGVGVLISAAMLAFALWRYSCIENYTRMQEFSDTDSIHDKKRGLDMYPTPHQTLPPLYTENDYKWADRTFDDTTRVDMGGFTNNTFTRDELSDESEDDVVAPRDRNSFKPRNFAEV